MADDLLAQATENASKRDDSSWGDRIVLEVGDSFSGRWRGETTTPSEYGEQPVYLLWNAEGEECFLYGGRVALDRQIRSASPGLGDDIAIARIEDESSNGRTVHRFGVAVARNEEPMPGEQTEIDW